MLCLSAPCVCVVFVFVYDIADIVSFTTMFNMMGLTWTLDDF